MDSDIQTRHLQQQQQLRPVYQVRGDVGAAHNSLTILTTTPTNQHTGPTGQKTATGNSLHPAVTTISEPYIIQTHTKDKVQETQMTPRPKKTYKCNRMHTHTKTTFVQSGERLFLVYAYILNLWAGKRNRLY